MWGLHLGDQYVSTIQGRLCYTFGQEHHSYTCGTLSVDHASGGKNNFCQLSNYAAETIKNKSRLEALAKEESFTIKTYHTDNSLFASTTFKVYCTSNSVV